MHLAADSSDAGFQGDVAAKEANQDAALGLVMMAARWWLLTWLGTSFQRAWVVLVALSVAHVCFATWSVRALALRRLNRDRLQVRGVWLLSVGLDGDLVHGGRRCD